MAGVTARKLVVIDGVTYSLEGGMLWRYFVKVDGSGNVVQDLEAGRESWVGIATPTDLVDVTANPQWDGVGSLMHYTKNQDGTFTKPAAPPADPSVSGRTFLELFTADERKAIRSAASGNQVTQTPPDLDIADLSYQIDTKIAQDGHIDMADPALAAGLDVLIAKGVLAADRKAQILAKQAPAKT